jgi:hypothetical protein
MLPPHFVPCQQDAISVRFFACTISVRAYPTAPTCKISMRRCAALRRPTCFELGCTCRFHECGGIGQCVLLHSVCTSFVRSKVESLRALHQYTNVQRGLALHAAPATLVARPAPFFAITTLSSHCGRCERRNQFASAYAVLRLQLGLRRSSCCVHLHANAMEDARKPSQRLSQRLYDALRRSKLKFAGRRVPRAIASCRRHKSRLGFFRRSQARR